MPSPLPTPPDQPVLRVDPLMADLQARVRLRLREQLRRRGKDTFTDQEIFDGVERLFRRALELPPDALLLPEIAEKPDAWRLETAIRFSSHRRWLGSLLVGVKRRLVLPLVQWLVDFDRVNLERQQALNETVLACLQTLAAEQADLRRDVEGLKAMIGSRAPESSVRIQDSETDTRPVAPDAGAQGR